MYILAIETTGPLASAALADGEKLIGKVNDTQYSHLEQIVPMVRFLLAENGVHPVFAAVNLKNGIVTHGSCPALYQATGLDPDGIFRKIMEVSSHEA